MHKQMVFFFNNCVTASLLILTLQNTKESLLLRFHRLAYSLRACGALSLALREENRLRVFREQSKDKDICMYVEGIGGSMKLHNNRFIISTCRHLSMKTRMGWVGHVACMEQKRNCGDI